MHEDNGGCIRRVCLCSCSCVSVPLLARRLGDGGELLPEPVGVDRREREVGGLEALVLEEVGRERDARVEVVQLLRLRVPAPALEIDEARLVLDELDYLVTPKQGSGWDTPPGLCSDAAAHASAHLVPRKAQAARTDPRAPPPQRRARCRTRHAPQCRAARCGLEMAAFTHVCGESLPLHCARV